MHDTDGIYSATARWDDQRALETLFASLPAHTVTNIREGRRQSPDRFSGMRYDQPTKRAFYIAANAEFIQVWTFKPVDSLEQGAAMWAAIVDADRIDQATAIRVYREVTGREVGYVQ
jgi:hypothetical protein